MRNPGWLGESVGRSIFHIFRWLVNGGSCELSKLVVSIFLPENVEAVGVPNGGSHSFSAQKTWQCVIARVFQGG
jgi:hypothetical protein